MVKKLQNLTERISNTSSYICGKIIPHKNNSYFTVIWIHLLQRLWVTSHPTDSTSSGGRSVQTPDTAGTSWCHSGSWPPCRRSPCPGSTWGRTGTSRYTGGTGTSTASWCPTCPYTANTCPPPFSSWPTSERWGPCSELRLGNTKDECVGEHCSRVYEV